MGFQPLFHIGPNFLFEVDHDAWQLDMAACWAGNGVANRGSSKVQGQNPGWSVTNQNISATQDLHPSTNPTRLAPPGAEQEDPYNF